MGWREVGYRKVINHRKFWRVLDSNIANVTPLFIEKMTNTPYDARIRCDFYIVDLFHVPKHLHTDVLGVGSVYAGLEIHVVLNLFLFEHGVESNI